VQGYGTRSEDLQSVAASERKRALGVHSNLEEVKMLLIERTQDGRYVVVETGRRNMEVGFSQMPPAYSLEELKAHLKSRYNFTDKAIENAVSVLAEKGAFSTHLSTA
jgi:hypothetical protein